MRENRTHGSEGGDGESRFRPYHRKYPESISGEEIINRPKTDYRQPECSYIATRNNALISGSCGRGTSGSQKKITKSTSPSVAARGGIPIVCSAT